MGGFDEINDWDSCVRIAKIGEVMVQIVDSTLPGTTQLCPPPVRIEAGQTKYLIGRVWSE